MNEAIFSEHKTAFPIWIKWVFILSCAAMSAGTSAKLSIFMFSGCILSFLVACYLAFRKNILESVFGNFSRKTAGIAFMYTFVAVGLIMSNFFINYPNVLYRIQTSIGIPELFQTALAYVTAYLIYLATAPVLFVFLYAFLTRFSVFVKDVYATSDKIDKIFFVAMMLVAFFFVVIVYNETKCFYESVYMGQLLKWDVVYTFDSTGYYLDYYYHPGFLHRSILYVFFLPFAVTAYLLGKILFFVPNIFPILLCVLQIALLGVTAILLSRLLQLHGFGKSAFLTFFSVSYSVMLNSITLDGYIVSTFWFVCFLYLFFCEKQKESCEYAYIAATGSLAVAGVFILMYARLKELRDCVARIVQISFSFIAFLIVFNVDFIENLFEALAYYGKYSGVKILFHERWVQFLNFVSSCFIKPETIIDRPFMKEVGDWMNYQLAPVKSMSMLGLALLALAITGFVLNYRNKFARICLFWMALSFLVLCLVGWGTAENGLILYSLYFGWAYFCLAFLAVEKLFTAWPFGRNAVLSLAIAALAYVNIPGIVDLIQFGIQYYPVN